jgi:serine/threonine-protein kinase
MLDMPSAHMTPATITCPSCRNAFSDTALFCPNCGKPKVVEADDGLLGKILGERFLVQERIGQGGSGMIYRAEHVTLRRKVAVKVLHHELSRDDLAVERFRREATSVGEIDNEHIVEIHDFGRTPDGRLYLAMELLEGETLDNVISRERSLSVERATNVLIQVGEALMEAHAIGYVHRDIRPRNIFLTQRRGKANFVKLLDFGLAKLVETDSQAASTSLGMTFGDPRYMSPEQARGDRIDRRADIYQLGCVAYEMLTGHPPFVGGKVFDILSRHVAEAPSPLPTRRPGTPLWLEAAVAKMLAKKPDDRFATTSRMVEALRRGIETGEVMEDDIARRRETVPPPSVSRVMQKLGMAPDAIPEPAAPMPVPVPVPAPAPEPVRTPTPRVVPSPRETAMGYDKAGERRKEPTPAPLPADNRQTAMGRPALDLPAAVPAPPIVPTAPPPPAMSIGRAPTAPAPSIVDEPVSPYARRVDEAPRRADEPPRRARTGTGEVRRYIEPEVGTDEVAPRGKRLASTDAGVSGAWFADGDGDELGESQADRLSRARRNSSGGTSLVYEDEEGRRRRWLLIGGTIAGLGLVVGMVAFAMSRGDDDKASVQPPPAPAPIANVAPTPDPVPPPAPTTVTPIDPAATTTPPTTTTAPPTTTTTPSKPPRSGGRSGSRGSSPTWTPPAGGGVPTGSEDPLLGRRPGGNNGSTGAVTPVTPVTPIEPVAPPDARPADPSGSGPVDPYGSDPSGGGPVDPYGGGNGNTSNNDTPPPNTDATDDTADGHAKRGTRALRSGDPIAAAASFKKALELDARNIEAIAGLGEVAIQQGLYEDALVQLKRAVKLAPKSARVHTLLGESHLNTRNNNAALASFKKALQLDPDNARARTGFDEASRRLPPPTDD